MSSRYDEYHRQADAALQMALTARNNEYRVSWLKVAEAWLRMIPQDEIKRALNDFASAAHKKDTGEGGSGSCH